MLFAEKSIGAEIHQGGCSFLLASGKKETPVIERFGTATFPDEVMRLSIKEANILNRQELVPLVADAWKILESDMKRISVSIPDLSGRIVILDLDSIPKHHEEGVDQIKWKLKKNFPLDLNDMHLDYQLLSTDGKGGGRALAAVISIDVVRDYEELFCEAGLEPVKIDFSTFNLIRLFSSRLDIQEDPVFISLYRGNLTVMGFQESLLDFHRSKAVAATPIDPVRLFREVNSSLLVYSDSRGGVKPQRIFYYAAPTDRGVLRSVLFESLGVEPVLIDTDSFISSSRQQLDRNQLPGLLSALGAASRGLS